MIFLLFLQLFISITMAQDSDLQCPIDPIHEEEIPFQVNCMEPPPETHWLPKTHRAVNKYLINVLYSKMESKRKSKHEQSLISLDQSISLPDSIKKDIRLALLEIDKKIQKGNDYDRLESILVLYPELKEDLLKTNPEFQPSFCLFDSIQKKKKVFQKWLSYFKKAVLISTIGGTTAIGLGWVAMPAIPAVLIGMGTANMVMGSVKLVNSIKRWGQVRQKNLAKDMLQISKESQLLIESGKVTDLEQLKTLKQFIIDDQKEKALSKQIKEGRKVVWEAVLSPFQIAVGYGYIAAGLKLQDYLDLTSSANTGKRIIQVGSGDPPPFDPKNTGIRFN